MIDGYVFRDNNPGSRERGQFGRYTIKDPNYQADPAERGMGWRFRRPDTVSFGTLGEIRRWLKTQPRKSAEERQRVHDKYRAREAEFQGMSEGVTESLDQPYRIKWEKSAFGDLDAIATLEDGTNLVIMFNNEVFQWMVEFYRSDRQDITGGGDAQRVFATVLKAIGEFIRKKKPTSIVFSSVKEEDPRGSRTRLYDRLVQRYANDLGYTLQKQEDSSHTVYRLNRKSDRDVRTVAEGEKQSSVSQLATVSDEALDKAYGYGRSKPGNTFGWQANLMSAAYAKKLIDAGITDIEKISDAIHKGWNTTAQKFVQDPDQFDDTEKLRQAGKLEAKLQQRAKLMKIGFAQLDNDEQEKDRVVARALSQAIKGQQGAQR